jgi:hypothetical protein
MMNDEEKKMNKQTQYWISIFIIVCIVGAPLLCGQDYQGKAPLPQSLKEAKILVGLSLFGLVHGPYSVEGEQAITPIIYHGEPVRFVLTFRHRGYSEVPLFREDGDLKKQISAVLRHDGKENSTVIEKVIPPFRRDSRGREASGLGPLNEGESIESVWQLSELLQAAEYELIIRFQAAGKSGEYTDKDEWRKQLPTLKFAVISPESDMDKLNVSLRKTYLLIEEDRSSEAKVELGKFLSEHPGCVFAHEYMGLCQLKLKENDRAVESFERAIEIIEKDEDENLFLSEYEKQDYIQYLNSWIDAAKSKK